MRTTSIGAFVLGGLAFASPAMAQNTATFTAQTDVPAFCSQFQTAQAPMELGALTGTSGQILTDFTSGANTERELSASYYCNAPSTITIKADPLIQDAGTVITDSTSFTNRVDYTATLTWANLQNAVSSTAANETVIDATQANIGALTLKLSHPTVANNLRPIAGNYAGQVRLTIALAQ